MSSVSKLAIDSGQTEIKVRSEDFTRTYPGVQTNRDILPQLAEAITAAATDFGAPFEQVAIGTSGLTDQDHDPERLLSLCQGVREVRLAHDSITAYLGALGHAPGVVIAAGTGVVTLGVGATSLARVDGWGHTMGDVGSGFWVGREAMVAAMRSFDGRGPRTKLQEVIAERYPQLDQAYIQLQCDPDWVRVVASFAKSVADLALEDPVAATICQRAGEELAESGLTAAHLVGLANAASSPVCLVGSLFKSERIRGACEQGLAIDLPNYQLVSPLGDGLLGAALLLEMPSDSPLKDHVEIARSSR